MILLDNAGGLDETLQGIISECQQQLVPFVFALNRSALGRACVRKVPVSIVGIFNYEGAEVSCYHPEDVKTSKKFCISFYISLKF